MTAGSVGVEAAPEAALSTYGRTFHWASAFLGRETGRDVRAFYALCRYADDLADELEPGAARRRLTALEHDLDVGASAHPAVAPFLEVAALRGLDLVPVRSLVRSVAADLEPARVQTADELVRYAYGVAGTVGLTLCRLFGATDPDARNYAVDLGVAMQLTNIARDVLDDAGRGRVYLPAEWLGRAVDPAELVADSGDARARGLPAVREALRLAAEFYRSADAGMCYLPPRPRAAVLTAARCYEAIGAAILARGERYWESRTVVGTAGKLRHTLRALATWTFDPRAWSSSRPQPPTARMRAPWEAVADREAT